MLGIVIVRNKTKLYYFKIKIILKRLIDSIIRFLKQEIMMNINPMKYQRITLSIFFVFATIFFVSAHEMPKQNADFCKAEKPEKSHLKSPKEDPLAFFTSVDQACTNDTLVFTNESSGDYTSIYWNFGDGYDTHAWETPFHIYDSAGVFTVTLKLTLEREGASPVVDSITKEITILPSPVADIHLADSLIYEGASTEISVFGDFTSVVWDTGETSETINAHEGRVYSVTVTDDSGCSTTLKSPEIKIESVSIEDGIVVLNNILTPNGDGINDFLLIKDLSAYKNPIEVTIYNTWGLKVFETADYRNTESWKATDVDAGTFYYHIRSEGMKGVTGFVDVIK
ncbi:MAG: hypothetical protein CSA05_01865 [Bacteroidia bacterium]|nr:MAG: hypothetical protein CSA05_01865 [Bacteroidia bacterium]